MSTLLGYYTTADAAEKLGYKTSDAIRHYAAQGKIPGAKKFGRSWLIPNEWVEYMLKLPVDPKGNRGLRRESKKM